MEMAEYINTLSFVLLLIISGICLKIWKASDTFFIKKAENYATKQDITEITKKTEEVQSEFHKIRTEFDTDLKFRYTFYENQYKELYAKLYLKICKSEALRFTLNSLSKDSYKFCTLPIVEYAGNYDENGNEVGDKSIIEDIVELVLEKEIYSSPELIKLICTFNAVENYEKHTETEDMIGQLEKELKIEIIRTIFGDYCWLRDRLHLKNDKDMIETLESDQFIRINISEKR